MATRRAASWAGALLISLAAANLASYLFADSTEAFVWSPVLEHSFRQPGSVHRHRSEGWADTRIGRFGVNGIADITALSGPKILFWGDSHVEGFPLADDEKLAQQFNRLPGSEAVTAIGVGFSGTTIATAYHLLPAFERLAAPVRAHFVVITRPDYILPDEGAREPYVLRPGPPPRLEARRVAAPDPRRQALIDWSARAGLPLFYRLYRQARGLDLRFRPGTATAGAEPAEERNPEAIDAAWSLLLTRLAERTSLPIVFVYCPRIPYLSSGRTVYEDPHRLLIGRFAERCREHRIPFIHLGDEFSRLHRTTGRFPRGFVNNNPYRGHLNRHGTRLVAERVAAFLAGS